MNGQEIKQLIENKVAELNQTAAESKQNMKTALVEKLALAESFVAQLNNSKEIVETQLAQSRALLSDLDKLPDLSQELNDFEQAIAQEEADLEKLSAEFQRILEETVNAQLNEHKAKTLFATEETEAKLTAAKELLSGKRSKAERYVQKLSSAFNAKFGDKLQKAKLMLAERLEVCAVKLKA